MTRRLLVLLLVLLSARAWAADPRVEEADALLADPEGFERAAALYRATLADAEDPQVRLRLARVLSWSEAYDESIAEYDALARSGEAPPGTRIERAEVLSWAGRYQEAEAAFRELLEEDPENARAARGLARVLAWSGRHGQADRAYARALALEEDAELRRDWARLRSGYPPTLESGADLYEDSDGFRRLQSFTRAGFHPDLDTQATLEVELTRLEADATPATAGLPRGDWGVAALAGASRRFGERTQARLALGGRSWDRADATFLARAGASYTLPTPGVLSASLEHGDFLVRSDSLAAVETGIRDTTTGLSLWHELPRRTEIWSRFQSSFLSDGNERLALEGSLAWQPWQHRKLLLQLAGGWLGYTGTSALYYDPASDVSVGVSARYEQELWRGLEAELGAGSGWGRTEQDGATSAGFAYHVSGSLAWVLGRVRLSLYAGRAQSRRASSYVSHSAGARLGLDF
jgi:tetratricopeptide (TPR) repeat protein